MPFVANLLFIFDIFRRILFDQQDGDYLFITVTMFEANYCDN